MKKSWLVLLLLNIVCNCKAQTEITALHETAKTFMRQGDYANAILVLNRGLQQSPGNAALSADLALTYYFQKDNQKALEVIRPVLEQSDVDDQCFQVAGNIYKELNMLKDCEKLYKKGLKRFPESGPLYNDYGELLWAQKKQEAIDQWEKGIEEDPSFARNYYNAARFYFLANDKIWSLLYGETFVNMEPVGKNTPEIKDFLLEGYKKLFAEADLEKDITGKSSFEKAFVQTMNKQSATATMGINTESLTMIRTRFILNWSADQQAAFPFRLFEFHQQLLQDGLFEAYNQWLFGSSENLARYQAWTVNHKEIYTAFTTFQQGRTFKIPAKQYYK